MAKEKDRVELKQVDEDAEKVHRFVRLHTDAVEEMVELPPVRVGGKDTPEARLMAATREELKTRSNEPNVGSLIEREEAQAEEQWATPDEAGRKIQWGWVALVGLIFAGGILWSLLEVGRSKDKQILLVDDAKDFLEKEKREELGAESMIDTIELSVRAFFDSRSVEEMLRYVRHPERVAPLLEIHYGKTPLSPLRVERVFSLDPLTIDNRASFWMVSCELAGGQVRQVLVEAISEKEAKVDWETFTCYQPMGWDEFARTRPGGYTGDFRVYVEPDNYYSFEFADSDSFLSFRLTALNGEETLYGYVARNTELEAAIMDTITRNGGGATPMILRLHLPEGVLSKRGVVVKEMISPRWMFLEDPQKEKP